jgi:hypothetical protein
MFAASGLGARPAGQFGGYTGSSSGASVPRDAACSSVVLVEPRISTKHADDIALERIG